ncbi:hypothetical protein IG631_04432 [Alternaria alternata]|nr:hypothetical protein IG631_04432 [Alternaria alternata]
MPSGSVVARSWSSSGTSSSSKASSARSFGLGMLAHTSITLSLRCRAGPRATEMYLNFVALPDGSTVHSIDLSTFSGR